MFSIRKNICFHNLSSKHSEKHMENTFMHKLALQKNCVKPIVVSQIIYLEMYLVDLMKIVQVKDAIFMLILQL